MAFPERRPPRSSVGVCDDSFNTMGLFPPKMFSGSESETERVIRFYCKCFFYFHTFYQVLFKIQIWKNRSLIMAMAPFHTKDQNYIFFRRRMELHCLLGPNSCGGTNVGRCGHWEIVHKSYVQCQNKGLGFSYGIYWGGYLEIER